MLSPRTAKYVDALIREGDNFDYRKWLRRVREEEAQAKQFPATCFLGELPPSEIGDLTNTPDLRDVRAISVPELHAKSPPTARAVHRSDHKAQRESPQDRLRRRLIRVSDAFDEFQRSRVRDAVYDYLKAVFALVVDYKGRKRTKRLLRSAFQFAGLQFDKNADPFATVRRYVHPHPAFARIECSERRPWRTTSDSDRELYWLPRHLAVPGPWCVPLLDIIRDRGR